MGVAEHCIRSAAGTTGRPAGRSGREFKGGRGTSATTGKAPFEAEKAPPLVPSRDPEPGVHLGYTRVPLVPSGLCRFQPSRQPHRTLPGSTRKPSALSTAGMPMETSICICNIWRGAGQRLAIRSQHMVTMIRTVPSGSQQTVQSTPGRPASTTLPEDQYASVLSIITQGGGARLVRQRRTRALGHRSRRPRAGSSAGGSLTRVQVHPHVSMCIRQISTLRSHLSEAMGLHTLWSQGALKPFPCLGLRISRIGSIGQTKA